MPEQTANNQLKVKPEDFVSWLPTEQDIKLAVRKVTEVRSGEGLKFHSLKVTADSVSHQELDGSANFVKHASRELTMESGLPTRLFFFYGARVEFSTPQVLVGLSVAGQKAATPVFLAKSTSNPNGDVPDRGLTAT